MSNLFMIKNILNPIIKKIILAILILGSQQIMGESSPYQINPGDTLEISVWNEEKLQRELKVLPDNTISFPLAGSFSTAGKTVNDIQKLLKDKLSVFIEDPVVNVAVKAVEGNAVFVMGQVNKPGSFVMYQPMNIAQILGLAGGFTTFAKTNSIVVLRATENGSKVIHFKYGDIEDGSDLNGNLLLKSGDVVIVP